jgi:hypothetical protein
MVYARVLFCYAQTYLVFYHHLRDNEHGTTTGRLGYSRIQEVA